MTAPLNQAQLARLAEFDTPTVCNVIELWDIRPRETGYMDARIRAAFPSLPPMVGYALTSTFRARTAPRQGDVYTSLDQQTQAFANLPGPAVVVFQDLDSPSAAATFGEVMCTTYQAFGAQGLITSGTGRDLDQVAALDFPVFTNGECCSHGNCHIPAVNVPVDVGGLTVNPGDLLHGDRNGVTNIPAEIASEIADACEELMAAEQIVLDYCTAGNVNPSGYAEARAACADRVKSLAQRLKAHS